jgi:hypothetical protein
MAATEAAEDGRKVFAALPSYPGFQRRRRRRPATGGWLLTLQLSRYIVVGTRSELSIYRGVCTIVEEEVISTTMSCSYVSPGCLYFCGSHWVCEVVVGRSSSSSSSGCTGLVEAAAHAPGAFSLLLSTWRDDM